MASVNTHAIARPDTNRRDNRSPELPLNLDSEANGAATAADTTSQSGGPQSDKGLSSQTDQDQASQVDADDPHKTEKLAKADRDIDADDASD